MCIATDVEHVCGVWELCIKRAVMLGYLNVHASLLFSIVVLIGSNACITYITVCFEERCRNCTGNIRSVHFVANTDQLFATTIFTSRSSQSPTDREPSQMHIQHPNRKRRHSNPRSEGQKQKGN